MPPVRVSLMALALLALAPRAAAEPTPTEPASPRSIGRAGTGLVSDDSAVNLLANPAAIARRGSQRLGLGIRIGEIDTELTGGSGRVAVDQSGPALVPNLSYARGLGDRWVIGAAVAGTADHQRVFPAPVFNQPPEDVEDLFFYRYGGLAGSATQRTLTAGGAVRAAEWLAIGAALRLSTLEVSETRAIWAGFSGREPVGSAGRDLLLEVDGRTFARPGAALGLLAAPVDVPVEIAAAVSIDLPASLDGDAALRSTTDAGSPPVPGAGGSASIKHPARIVAATGVRYLGERWIAEVNGELGFTAGARPRWRLAPIDVTDESGAVGALETVAPLLDVRRQYAVRGAVDVAVVPGFLWATAGYGFTSAAAPTARRNPLLAGPKIHRVAAGVEALWSDFTVTVGYARELSPPAGVADTAAGVAIVNPFDAGTALATQGRYQRSGDIGALQVEYVW